VAEGVVGGTAGRLIERRDAEPRRPRHSRGRLDIVSRLHSNSIEQALPMAHYTAEILWQRGEQPFTDNRYSRRHLLRFDGGVEVPGSSSPHVVPLPMSDASAVDPEEAFVASLSSCHMLWFLAIAAKRKFRVDRYFDAAVGTMGMNAEGREAMLTVTLRPEVLFSGDRVPTPDEIADMHHEAHEECFIANSVKTEVRCEPAGLR
jgi:organic hydroperoxide reductase OsmC/OhrA